MLQLGLCLGVDQILWEKKDSNPLLKVGGLVHVLHAERMQKGTVSYPQSSLASCDSVVQRPSSFPPKDAIVG